MVERVRESVCHAKEKKLQKREREKSSCEFFFFCKERKKKLESLFLLLLRTLKTPFALFQVSCCLLLFCFLTHQLFFPHHRPPPKRHRALYFRAHDAHWGSEKMGIERERETAEKKRAPSLSFHRPRSFFIIVSQLIPSFPAPPPFPDPNMIRHQNLHAIRIYKPSEFSCRG